MVGEIPKGKKAKDFARQYLEHDEPFAVKGKRPTLSAETQQQIEAIQTDLERLDKQWDKLLDSPHRDPKKEEKIEKEIGKLNQQLESLQAGEQSSHLKKLVEERSKGKQTAKDLPF